ncbi:MAG: hypothetical protein AAGU74_04860 [Bacillota bacterium]
MKDLNDFGITLRKRAHWTHSIIKRSAILGLGIMEETLTDMHLFSIADEYNENIITKKFSRREEGSKSGADWLWVVGEPGSWIPLLVQAKIINPKTGNCQHFDYKDGEQRKRLLLYARQHSYIPVYCIYSSIPADFEPPAFLDRDGRQKEDWACSFISPKSVRFLSRQGIKNQNEILKLSIPWMDPFCRAAFDVEPMGQAVAKAIVDIRDGFEESTIKRLTSKVQIEQPNLIQKRINWENMDSIQSIKKEIPRAICNMFRVSSFDSTRTPLAGVSIISTIPINQIKELSN